MDDELDAFMKEIEEVEDAGGAAAAGSEHRLGDEEEVEYDLKGDANAGLVAAQRQSVESASVRFAGWNGKGETPKVMASFLGDGKELPDPLPPIDHSKVAYEAFRRDFFRVHPMNAKLTAAQAEERRRSMGLTLSDSPGQPDNPVPITAFGQCGFDTALLLAVRKAGYHQPTPIQAQALPLALQGRDIVGISRTGSGKTLAFSLPLCIHCIDQREVVAGDGPIALVLVPTRELADQVTKELARFVGVHGMTAVSLVGGEAKWPLAQRLRRGGVEVVVSTPGRLIDMIKDKATNLRRVSLLVLDEVDRLLSMGFEAQVRSLARHCRPDRQTLCFTATLQHRRQGSFRSKGQQRHHSRLWGLLDEVTRAAVTVSVDLGAGTGAAAELQTQQRLYALPDDASKWQWFCDRLPAFLGQERVLVFVATRAAAQQLTASITRHPAAQKEAARSPPPAGSSLCMAFHGDMDQRDRRLALSAFRAGTTRVLVATGLASRGLDVQAVSTVVNYDCPKTMSEYIHRIGRTGRMSRDGGEATIGVAHTLLSAASARDVPMAARLVEHAHLAGQAAPPEVLALARRHRGFRAPAVAHPTAAAAAAAGAGGAVVLAGQKRARAVGTAPTGPFGVNAAGRATFQQAPSAAVAAAGQEGPPPPRVLQPRKLAPGWHLPGGVQLDNYPVATLPAAASSATSSAAAVSVAGCAKRSRWDELEAPAPAATAAAATHSRPRTGSAIEAPVDAVAKAQLVLRQLRQQAAAAENKVYEPGVRY